MSNQDPAKLVFTARTDRRPARRRATDPVRVLTYVFVAVAFVALALMVRQLLARAHASAAPVTIGGSVSAVEPALESSPPVMTDDRPKVFRCVGRSGGVSFQSHPCAPGERTTAEIDAIPDSASDIARARARQRDATRAAARMAAIAGTQGANAYQMESSDDRDVLRARCADAKARRDARLRAVGLARTYELLQQLDASVYEACKGL